jgi:hypothetical protein
MSTEIAGRLALEASTDQAFAVARESRDAPGAAEFAESAGWLAGMIAEQFPGARVLAGRVLMAAAQFVATAAADAPDLDTAAVATTMVFAAEQVVREAGAT